MRCCEEIEL